jgi:hypothetical protein
MSIATANSSYLATRPGKLIPAAGFQRALSGSSIFVLAAGLIALRSTNTHGEEQSSAPDASPEIDRPLARLGGRGEGGVLANPDQGLVPQLSTGHANQPRN